MNRNWMPIQFSRNWTNVSERLDYPSALHQLHSTSLSALRSTKVGEQCEAIVRFPKVFEKYPFPILINSSFLKLAEFFQNG